MNQSIVKGGKKAWLFKVKQSRRSPEWIRVIKPDKSYRKFRLCDYRKAANFMKMSCVAFERKLHENQSSKFFIWPHDVNVPSSIFCPGDMIGFSISTGSHPVDVRNITKNSPNLYHSVRKAENFIGVNKGWISEQVEQIGNTFRKKVTSSMELAEAPSKPEKERKASAGITGQEATRRRFKRIIECSSSEDESMDDQLLVTGYCRSIRYDSVDESDLSYISDFETTDAEITHACHLIDFLSDPENKSQMRNSSEREEQRRQKRSSGPTKSTKKVKRSKRKNSCSETLEEAIPVNNQDSVEIPVSQSESFDRNHASPIATDNGDINILSTSPGKLTEDTPGEKDFNVSNNDNAILRRDPTGIKHWLQVGELQIVLGPRRGRGSPVAVLISHSILPLGSFFKNMNAAADFLNLTHRSFNNFINKNYKDAPYLLSVSQLNSRIKSQTKEGTKDDNPRDKNPDPPIFVIKIPRKDLYSFFAKNGQLPYET